jgi:hypothetical protein
MAPDQGMDLLMALVMYKLQVRDRVRSTPASGLPMFSQRGSHNEPIHARCAFALIDLRDLPDCHKGIGAASQHELLQRGELAPVSLLGCPKDPLSQIAHGSIGVTPVDVIPVDPFPGSVCGSAHPTFTGGQANFTALLGRFA